MARVIGLILPLSLDTFAIAAALGMTGLTGNQRIRYGLLFAAFEWWHAGHRPLDRCRSWPGHRRLVGVLAIVALAAVGAYILFWPDRTRSWSRGS